jgi:hypothetical protein
MDRESLLLEQWKAGSELHRHSDIVLWQQFNHFVTVHGILVSALALMWSSIDPNDNLAFASVLMSAFGLAFSLTWYIIQKRSQLYHRYRVAQIRETEIELTIDDKRVLTLYEKGLNEQDLIPVRGFARLPTYSVVLFLPTLLSLAWLAAIIFFLIQTCRL